MHFYRRIGLISSCVMSVLCQNCHPNRPETASVPAEGKQSLAAESTTLQVGAKSVTITLNDLIELREALRSRAEEHTDRDALRAILKDAQAFITQDGVPHVGGFRLVAEEGSLWLIFVPMPQKDFHDTFGFASRIEGRAGRWKLAPIVRVHEW